MRLKHRSGGCGTASALPKCSIRLQYYLRFWLSICRTSLAVSALRIMRYCHNSAVVPNLFRLFWRQCCHCPRPVL
ncbi:MAG: hypothetical protein MR806_04240 [Subdoligranulum sp.]|nr:hypothetical protein [Subdoligranulum sp.]